MAIFTSKPGSPSRPDASGLTIVAAGTTIVGDLISEGVVKIEGQVEGTIRAAMQLLIAPGAQIRGDIFAREIIAGGEVHGGVHAEERVEIQAGAMINGDIRTHRIHVADGGRVNGQITMEQAPAERGSMSSPSQKPLAESLPG